MRKISPVSSTDEATSATEERSLFHIFRTPYRKRLLQLAAVWAVAYVASQNAVAFWKEFAVAERGLTDGQVGAAIALASVTSMPLVFGVGPLIDVIGRRRGAAIVFSLGALGTFLSYTLHGQWPLTGALVLGAAGLLNGYRATTHWLSHDILRLFGAEPVDERVVIDRNRITGAGVTAGIDFGLTIAAELFGPRVAQEIQLSLEYWPVPPFDSGSPKTAPADVVQQLIATREGSQSARRAIAERAARRMALNESGAPDAR